MHGLPENAFKLLTQIQLEATSGGKEDEMKDESLSLVLSQRNFG
jgi:hypothetical protein